MADPPSGDEIMKYHALSARIIEQRQGQSRLWEDWITNEDRRRHGYLGSMSWSRRGGEQGLYRRVGSHEQCLGPRSRETEAIFRGFQYGRGRLEKRLLALAAEMGSTATALRHLGDGVVPQGPASLLREIRIHGKALGAVVIDDTALDVYAAMAGGVVQRGASMSPANRIPQLKLLVDAAQQEEMIAVLRSHVDRSFEAVAQDDGHIVTSDALVVKLCQPAGCLQWLAQAPKVEAILPDKRGFPVPVRCPDPRYWLAYHLWMVGPQASDMTSAFLLDLIHQQMPQVPIDADCLSRMPGPLAERLRVELLMATRWPGSPQTA